MCEGGGEEASSGRVDPSSLAGLVTYMLPAVLGLRFFSLSLLKRPRETGGGGGGGGRGVLLRVVDRGSICSAG